MTTGEKPSTLPHSVIESIEIYRVQVFLFVHKKLPRTKIGQNSFCNVVSENEGYVERHELLPAIS
jgi:hypothetical protein